MTTFTRSTCFVSACLALMLLGPKSSLAQFNGANGAHPYAGVVEHSTGNLWGTASGGGAHNDGVIWEIPYGTITFNVYASFDGANGSGPIGGVTQDSSGNLWGTTLYGGADNGGVVWEIPSGTSTIKAFASFDGANGWLPAAGVMIDSNGNLWGTTETGGAGGYGVVWEVPKGSTAMKVVVSFDGANGAYPVAGVTEDSNGNLWGTTTQGGASDDGVVWEIPKGSSTLKVVAGFNGSNGDNPAAGVMEDSNGNFWGTAANGGAGGYGVVWEIAKGSTTLKVVASFNGANGISPYAGVTEDSHGNLWGTTFDGGSNGLGVVWEIPNGSTTLSAVGGFYNSTGAHPYAGVMVDSDGDLWGTTEYGGLGYNGPFTGDGGVWIIKP